MTDQQASEHIAQPGPVTIADVLEGVEPIGDLSRFAIDDLTPEDEDEFFRIRGSLKVAPAVVVDTMIASAWLSEHESPRKARWAPVVEPAVWVLPFVVVAEMRFGAEVAEWGARRRAKLDRLVGATGVVPPLPEVVDAYVDLRTWCVRNGHGLAGKEHEADRWVGAVAIAAGLVLASDDSIFRDVPTLRLAVP